MPGQDRLISLDFFRGITIAAMILVNNPGSWSHIYPPLRHAEWHGWTMTDTIFPFFLFIVGVSISLAFSSKKANHTPNADLYKKILRRTVILFALGLFLSGFPYFDLSSIRIPGVLQRIAVCYLFASIIFLHCSVRMQAVWAFALMLIYWAAMEWVPVPGIGAGLYDRGANFSAWVDSIFLSGHVWAQTSPWDPEGIVSTLPAISTTLFGVLTGHLLGRDFPVGQKVRLMLAYGSAAIVTGWLWHAYLPINKSLWTSSYALFMSGLAMVVLAISIYLIDVQGWRKWTKPFRVYGMNAITVFVLSGVVGRLLYMIKWQDADGVVSLKSWMTNTFFMSWLSPINGSLAYAICFVLLSYLAMHYLYVKKIFLKV